MIPCQTRNTYYALGPALTLEATQAIARQG